MEIELEKTYLLQYIPEDLKDHDNVEIFDIYVPKSQQHPNLRIRKRGEIAEITKKFPVDSKDISEQEEHTIPLLEEEFQAFTKVEGKKIRKIRYFYPIDGNIAEISIFLDELKGLAMVDVEFKTKEEKEKFEMPEFCLADVTQELYFAGGILAGKKYLDIEPVLDKYSYKKII